MAKQRDPNAPQRLPGNDGTWFLKAVGIDRDATELGDVSVDGDSTSETVKELWGAEVNGDQLREWVPEALSKTVERRRSFRWPMAIGAAAALAAIVAVVLWFPGSSDRRAAARSSDFAAAFSSLISDLPATQQALAVLTEPDADVSQFADLIPTITGASRDAATALDLAGEPLPRPWPLAPAGPFEELVPYRDALSVDATTAQAITRRLGNLLDYRTVLQQFLDVGELPANGSGVDVNALATELAMATADAAAVFAELPDDAALAEHKAAAEEALARFSDDQAEYLDALRNGRDGEAEVWVVEFEAVRDELNEELAEALSRMRREIDDGLISLNGSIEESLRNLPA